jgi:hypothetical protein
MNSTQIQVKYKKREVLKAPLFLIDANTLAIE